MLNRKRGSKRDKERAIDCLRCCCSWSHALNAFCSSLMLESYGSVAFIMITMILPFVGNSLSTYTYIYTQHPQLLRLLGYFIIIIDGDVVGGRFLSFLFLFFLLLWLHFLEGHNARTHQPTLACWAFLVSVWVCVLLFLLLTFTAVGVSLPSLCPSPPPFQVLRDDDSCLCSSLSLSLFFSLPIIWSLFMLLHSYLVSPHSNLGLEDSNNNDKKKKNGKVFIIVSHSLAALRLHTHTQTDKHTYSRDLC